MGDLKFSRELVKRKQKTNIQIHFLKYHCKRLELGLKQEGETEGPRELHRVPVTKALPHTRKELLTPGRERITMEDPVFTKETARVRAHAHTHARSPQSPALESLTGTHMPSEPFHPHTKPWAAAAPYWLFCSRVPARHPHAHHLHAWEGHRSEIQL